MPCRLVNSYRHCGSVQCLHLQGRAMLISRTLTYLLHRAFTASRVLLEKLTGFQLVKKFPAFYGTRRFITAVTSARQLPPSWASSIQSIHPHLTSWRSVLILSSHLSLDLPSGLFPSGFPTNTPYTSFLSPPLPSATCPDHPLLTANPKCH